VAVLGVPIRLGSISGGRFDLAPAAVRGALGRFSVWDGERDLRQIGARDLGDLDVADSTPADAFDTISEGVAEARDGTTTGVVVLLGGDNSITRPGVRGIAPVRSADGRLDPGLDRVGLLTFDAHHDLRDTEAGMLNGNPVRALLEDGLPGRNIVQVGIQPFANSPDHAAVAREAGITVVTADDVRDRGMRVVVAEALRRLDPTDAVYVDLDVDVLDRAFAPARPGARPGGLTPGELQTAARACGAHPKVAGIDLVEVDPERDVADSTVLATASFLLAFAGGLATRP
jgi:formiminoglutamase